MEFSNCLPILNGIVPTILNLWPKFNSSETMCNNNIRPRFEVISILHISIGHIKSSPGYTPSWDLLL